MPTNAREVGAASRAVAAEVRALRARKNVDQKTMAAAIEMAQSTLHDLEKANKPIYLEQLMQIAAYFDMPGWELLKIATDNDAELQRYIQSVRRAHGLGDMSDAG